MKLRKGAPVIWTSRTVEFTPYPRTSHARWEALFDSLPEHYWSRPDWVRRLVEPSLASCDRVISVSGLPRWMPKWWARRTMALLAAAHGVGGHAEYRIERNVLT